HPTQEAVWKVSGYCIESRLEVEHAVRHAPFDQGQIIDGAIVVLVALQQRRCQIEMTQAVAQAGGQLLLTLEFATQQQQAEICDERKAGRETIDGPIEPVGGLVATCVTQRTASEAVDKRSRDELDITVHVRKESLVEPSDVACRRRFHFLEKIRMAANGALPEDHQTTRED